MLFSLFLIVFILVVLGGSGTFGWQHLSYGWLRRSVARWQQNGWVTPEGAEAILNERRPQGLQNRLVFLVGLLGALLLVMSVISFVAANWDEMSRLARLTWLVALLWATYLAGWRLVANGHEIFAEAAWLLGVGLFGANIALIAQMFHIDSHPPAGVLMWTFGALMTAALVSSRAALVLTYGGALTWTLMESLTYGALVHWPFLLLWALTTALALWHRWRFSYHLALLSLLVWLLVSLVRYGDAVHWSEPGLVGLVALLFVLLFALALILRANRFDLPLEGFEDWLERYAYFGLLGSLFVFQIVLAETHRNLFAGGNALLGAGPLGWLPGSLVLATAVIVLLYFLWREGLSRLEDAGILSLLTLFILGFSLAAGLGTDARVFVATWIYGALFLALLIWFMALGHRVHADLFVWGALAGFGAEVLYIYVRVFGSLLETSLFFFVGGILTLLLAAFLYRLYQRLDERERKSPEVSS